MRGGIVQKESHKQIQEWFRTADSSNNQMRSPILSCDVIPLGTSWLNSTLVYQKGKIYEHVEDSIRKRINAYLAEYPGAVHLNLWLDIRKNILFSAAQNRGYLGNQEFNFNDSQRGFLTRKWGLPFIRRQIAPIERFREKEMIYNTESVYGRTRAFDKVLDNGVLIVLGGESTNSVGWETLDVDQVWTCNAFYNNSKLKNRPADLVALGPHVPLKKNIDLENYISEFRPTVLFEIHKVNDLTFQNGIKHFVMDKETDYTYMHLRYASYLGLGSRLICQAVILGARKVYFVGLDGLQDQSTAHAFEPGKQNPSWFKRHGEQVQARQLVIFWEYLLCLKNYYGAKIYNLGEAGSHCKSNAISTLITPLPAEMKRSLTSNIQLE